jgi:hypothetical protein
MVTDDTATAGRRRVFAETVEYTRLRRREVLHALASRRVQLVVAVRGDDDPTAVIVEARAAGVGVALWPMLADAEGRWANLGNAERFVAHTRALVDALAARDALPDELCLDLEPPIAAMRGALDGSLAPPRFADDAHARCVDALAGLVRQLATRGIATWATIVPLVLADRPHRQVWQGVMGTPVDDVPLAAVSTMLYTSLVRGYSRGALGRAAAESLLVLAARRARVRFGDRAAMALGAVGPGALGDEAVYREPGELRRDVALVRAAGIDDIALFELGGALRRGPLEAWLDPLVDDVAPAHARRSLRAHALGLAALATSRGAPPLRWLRRTFTGE